MASTPAAFLVGQRVTHTSYQVVATQGMQSVEVEWKGNPVIYDKEIALQVAMTALRQFPAATVEMIEMEVRTTVKKIDVLRRTPL